MTWRHWDTMAAGVLILSEGPEERASEALYDYEDEILNYARDNAPWNDRTGWAREGLYTAVETGDGEVSLMLAHSVEYGYWLEVIQNGRFATIMPTLEAYADEVFEEAGAKTMAVDLL